MDLISLALVIALSLWSQSVARRSGAPVLLRHVPLLLGGLWITELLCLLLTIRKLITAFHPVVGLTSAQRSEYLARGISEAMNFTAFGLMVMLVPLVAIAVALVYWSRRLPKE